MCPLCGNKLDACVGDDIFLYYLRPAKALLGDTCAALKRISETQSPICVECIKIFQQFVKQRAGILGAEFLVFYTNKMMKGREIRDRLAELRREGVRLGRPPKIRPEEKATILSLRSKGLSYSQIQKQTGFNKGFIGRTLQSV